MLPKHDKYTVSFSHLAVGDRHGMLTCTIRNNEWGKFVGISMVSFERSSDWGAASIANTLHYVSGALVSRAGGKPVSISGFKTWDEMKRLAHALAVEDAMSDKANIDVLGAGGAYPHES